LVLSGLSTLLAWKLVNEKVAGIFFLPGVFLGLVYILGIKFRKSPFDLSMSHHAHQELIKGTVTEFSGKTLAMVEVAHWYENISYWLRLSVLYLVCFLERFNWAA
jgi:formate hydrogenlyase subunit 4